MNIGGYMRRCFSSRGRFSAQNLDLMSELNFFNLILNILFLFCFQKYNNKKIRRRQVSDDFFLQCIYFSPKRFKRRAFLLLYIIRVYYNVCSQTIFFFTPWPGHKGYTFHVQTLLITSRDTRDFFFLFFVLMVPILRHFFGNVLRTYFEQTTRVVRVT